MLVPKRCADCKPLDLQTIDQVKGWTRASVVMTFLVAASELDLTDSASVEKLKPLMPILDKSWMIPGHVPSL